MITWLAPLGIIIAIILIINFAMKGYSILFIGPLASLIVILTNNMNIFTGLISGPNSYMMGLAKFIASFFAVFLLGSILAKYIEDSGAAKAIARQVLKITGTKKPYSVLLAILFVCSFLTYGGVSLFVVLFAVLPLSRPIFREMRMSWSLVTIPVQLGLGTFTMTMLPGTPSIQNVIPTKALGTTLTAAPLLGMVAAVVALVVGLWYMKWALDKSLRNGEVYDEADKDSIDDTSCDSNLPGIFASVSPLLVLIAIVMIGSIFKIADTIIIGLVASIVVVAVLLNKYINNHKTVINNGAQGAVIPIFLTAAAVGFGSVINAAPGFKTVSDLILGIPGSPLISLTIATSLMSIVTGSSSGTLGIIMQAFAQFYLDLGINPEVIHRIAVIASGPLSAMPHSGAVLSFLALTGLTHKKCYKHFLLAMTVPSLAALVIVLIIAIIM